MRTSSSPERYLHGDRGARVVIIPQRVAAWLHSVVDCQREQHRRVRERYPELDAVLVALALAALEVTHSETGSGSAPLPEEAGQSTGRTVGTNVLAGRLNCTQRAITQAICDGRLAASKDDGGRWRINEDEAERFASEYGK